MFTLPVAPVISLVVCNSDNHGVNIGGVAKAKSGARNCQALHQARYHSSQLQFVIKSLVDVNQVLKAFFV